MVRKKLEIAEPIVYDSSLHTKYRPIALDDVVGQKDVIKSLKASFSAKARAHVYLFTGPSGTGKTSLARILASKFEVQPSNLLEIDAATNNGIDVIRDIMAPLQYQGFGDSPNKAVILDEAHMLTKQAWASLLKIVEEPPQHVFFFFCTTEISKVPANILTRCLSYKLKNVGSDDIFDLLDRVCAAEGYETDTNTLNEITKACQGSPRLALVMLAILEAPLESNEVIDLCRLLVRGDLTWPVLQKTIKNLEDSAAAESIRIVCVNYLASCLLSSKSEKETIRMLGMLECFSRVCNPTDKMAPILIAFGRYIYP
jgi:DNA polymerase III gamma/tau subunit